MILHNHPLMRRSGIHKLKDLRVVSNRQFTKFIKNLVQSSITFRRSACVSSFDSSSLTRVQKGFRFVSHVWCWQIDRIRIHLLLMNGVILIRLLDNPRRTSDNGDRASVPLQSAGGMFTHFTLNLLKHTHSCTNVRVN